MVLFIAALHALPLFLVAWNSNTRASLLIVAVISGAVAIQSGNPAYTLVDLAAIALALPPCLRIIKRRVEKVQARRSSESPETRESNDYFWPVAGVIGVVAFILLRPSDGPRPLPRQPISAPNVPVAASSGMTPAIDVQNAPVLQSTPRGKVQESSQGKELTIDRCVRIADERKMIQCLEKLK